MSQGLCLRHRGRPLSGDVLQSARRVQIMLVMPSVANHARTARNASGQRQLSGPCGNKHAGRPWRALLMIIRAKREMAVSDITSLAIVVLCMIQLGSRNI